MFQKRCFTSRRLPTFQGRFYHLFAIDLIEYLVSFNAQGYSTVLCNKSDKTEATIRGHWQRKGSDQWYELFDLRIAN